jgi:hypothetical protein
MLAIYFLLFSWHWFLFSNFNVNVNVFDRTYFVVQLPLENTGPGIEGYLPAHTWAGRVYPVLPCCHPQHGLQRNSSADPRSCQSCGGHGGPDQPSLPLPHHERVRHPARQKLEIFNRHREASIGSCEIDDLQAQEAGSSHHHRHLYQQGPQ